MKFNDIDMKNWKESDINTDSLWVISERDKSGKHKNIYHGNFIPQIPNQLIRRYTKENDIILEPFMGSGTTLFECEKLNRKYVGFDINPKMLDYVNDSMNDGSYKDNFYINYCNSLDEIQVDENIANAEIKFNSKNVQFILIHPPYMDIVKFTDNKNDLSQINNINDFVKKFKIICKNSLKHLEKDRYFAIVIGDVYKNSEVIPLGFYCMDMIKRNFKVKLKGTIIKNIEGNRGKLGVGGIWRYRALNSDYYIFKHEYMFVGTGKSNTTFDIELWKDIARLKPNDKIIFYVQSLKKFYGFFEVTSNPFFDSKYNLQPIPMPFLGDNEIKLQYRALIRPYQVYQYGIDEFDLVDILPSDARDVLWSILYRKLKGSRGCSPLFKNEFDIIFQKIAHINNNLFLNNQNFTFNNEKISVIQNQFQYMGQTNIPNIKQDIFNGNYRESHIHALLIQFLNQQHNVQWLGNEVYSGAGMQAMDILAIDNQNVFHIYEIKREEINNNITIQILKYIQWLQNRFQSFDINDYQPILIGKWISGQRKLSNRIDEFNNFNTQQISLPIIYIEYEINANNGTIDFYKIDYINNSKNLLWQI